MRFFDPGFRKQKTRYILQPILAALSISVVLVVLDARANAAVIAALGASSFIVFTVPRAKVSSARFMVGGYAVGILSGYLCHYLCSLDYPSFLSVFNTYSFEIFGALSVGLSIFLMSVTDTEHPPAASLALGLVLNDFNHRTLLVVLVGIVTLAGIRELFRPAMRNLI